MSKPNEPVNPTPNQPNGHQRVPEAEIVSETTPVSRPCPAAGRNRPQFCKERSSGGLCRSGMSAAHTG